MSCLASSKLGLLVVLLCLLLSQQPALGWNKGAVKRYHAPVHEKRHPPNPAGEDADATNVEYEDVVEEVRTHTLRHVTGPGCPYAASWLLHVSLFCATKWFMTSTKMETATFNVFDRGDRRGFQFVDPDLFYVNHMSMYEHWYHKRFGFGEAAKQTFLFSNTSYTQECFHPTQPLKASRATEYLGLLPFYGGLPPNVTDTLKVRSIGEGNSLVNSQTKALQAMAAVCSMVKYFGHVLIGVSNEDDRTLMNKAIHQLPAAAHRNVHIVKLKMERPSHLPFHTLAYGQAFVKRHNCRIMADPELLVQSKFMDAYDICDLGEDKGALKLKMAKNEHGPVEDLHTADTYSGEEGSSSTGSRNKNHRLNKVIRYVYYTESDQILRIKDMDLLYGLSSVSDGHNFILPRRKEKMVPSDPLDYMGNLTNGRECGAGVCTFNYTARGRHRLVFDEETSPAFRQIQCVFPEA